MFFWPEMQGFASRSSARGERGSILIAAVLFLFFVFLIAGLAVDVSRYYLRAEQAQNIADGAALAGARALGQYDFDVNEDKVHSQVLDYIEANQGRKYAELYSTAAAGQLHDIEVAEFPADTSAQSCQSFSINNGSMRTTRPTTAKTEVLGTALEVSGNPVPITAKLRISDPDNPNVSSETEPWGPFNNPNAGDMNDGGDNAEVDLSDVDEGMEVDVVARSWDNGQERMTVTTGDDNAFTFTDGDNMFQEPGYKGQGSTGDFVEDYLDDNGEVDIQPNQAIVFFELYAQPDDDVPWNDKQDLVVLLTFGSGNASGGRFGGSLPAWMTSNGTPCGNSMPVYRVGVPVFDSFEPVFLPESVFGSNEEKAQGIVKTAVAEVRPRVLRRYGKAAVNCAVFSGGQANVNPSGIRVTSNNTGSSGSLCSNGNVSVNTTNPGIDRVVMSDNATLGGSGAGGVGKVSRFSGNRQIPTLSSAFTSNATGYTVNMSQSNYTNQFPEADAAGCDAASSAPWWDSNAPNRDKQMVAGADPIVWQGSGDPVCVQEKNGGFQISGNGQMVNANDPNQSLTIYTDQDLQLNGQITLNGGIFSTGNIAVNGAGHSITGDPDNVGGLALWAQNNLNVSMQVSAAGSALRGIVGARGDVTFGPTNDNSPALQGLLIAGGQLTLRGNTQMNIIHDPSAYDASVLDANDWTERRNQAMGATIPPMAEATVRLID